MGFFSFLQKYFGPPRYTLFISYSRKHENFARGVHNFFKIQNLPFLDKIDIRPTDIWHSTIDDAIKHCTYFCIIWCIHAGNSKYVQLEIDRAIKAKKRILIILIGNYPLPAALSAIQKVPEIFEKICSVEAGDNNNHEIDDRQTVDAHGEDNEIEDDVRAVVAVENSLKLVGLGITQRLTSDYASDLKKNRFRNKLYKYFGVITSSLVISFPLILASYRVGLSPSVINSHKPQISLNDDFKDCLNGCPQMMVVPAGKFTMGSSSDDNERSQLIEFDRFAVGRFPVTVDEWDNCVADRACSAHHNLPGDSPAAVVSLRQAEVFTAWLSAKTGKKYRLLTHAEREYIKLAGIADGFWPYYRGNESWPSYGGFRVTRTLP
jgi:Sulfatase-modifying factor enzyme 1/TIR domain